MRKLRKELQTQSKQKKNCLWEMAWLKKQEDLDVVHMKGLTGSSVVANLNGSGRQETSQDRLIFKQYQDSSITEKKGQWRKHQRQNQSGKRTKVKSLVA